ncbi:DUF2076 family protein [Telluria aromaticivorans]|uniref:DUF2076 family protein n=1 Tax=Telluria aromaticivorans TaxID=2725995 RepID=A0A7Y2K2X7_9BURK|nr:DUF2076 family protein [Telluria aromaticivorans]NNG25328.1 DUF2076 family protein [Telluria aromaticivorans]
MSPSDAQVLHDFLGQLVQARGLKKDPEADALIQRAVEQQPDAAYLLVQRVLLMEQALNSAKSQIATLENQLRQQPQYQQHQQTQGGGFLDSVFGHRRQVSHPQSHHMSYQHAYPGSMGSGMPGFLRGGGGGGLLGSIAATAAGVAAGSFLFHGLDNIFHDHDGNGAAHLLGDNQLGGSDLSGSALADQAGLGDIGQADNLLDSEPGLDGNGGVVDGDGSEDGLFG